MWTLLSQISICCLSFCLAVHLSVCLHLHRCLPHSHNYSICPSFSPPPSTPPCMCTCVGTGAQAHTQKKNYRKVFCFVRTQLVWWGRGFNAPESGVKSARSAHWQKTCWLVLQPITAQLFLHHEDEDGLSALMSQNSFGAEWLMTESELWLAGCWWTDSQTQVLRLDLFSVFCHRKSVRWLRNFVHTVDKKLCEEQHSSWIRPVRSNRLDHVWITKRLAYHE